MKIKRNKNKILIFINVILSILFLLPVIKLNLYNENYSTLSLTTRGYLYVLLLGLTIGLIFWYELNIINKSKYNILIFIFMLLGTIVPHHVPYNLQGNLHLVFAYIGFVGMFIMTFINVNDIKIKNFYILCVFMSIVLYLKFGMVNTLSEIIVMISTIIVLLIECIRKDD